MTRLTAQSILTTLAALGTSALVGCGSSNPAPQSPVDAKEVHGHGAGDKAQAGCSAAGCGAKAAETPKSPDVAAPTDTKGADATKAAETATPVSTPADDAKDKTKDPKKTGKKGAGKQGGAASCGAGTCSAAAPPAKK